MKTGCVTVSRVTTTPAWFAASGDRSVVTVQQMTSAPSPSPTVTAVHRRRANVSPDTRPARIWSGVCSEPSATHAPLTATVRMPCRTQCATREGIASVFPVITVLLTAVSASVDMLAIPALLPATAPVRCQTVAAAQTGHVSATTVSQRAIMGENALASL